MTKENLLRYLRDPAYLHQISYQELKTLVAEHPNSYTLRHLLAIKSRQEGNDDLQRQKEFAALYSIDRPHLFDVLTREEILEALPEGVLLQDDYLELKELSALEKELSMANVVGSVAASTSVASIALSETPDIPPSTKISLPAIEFEEEINDESEEYYTLDFDEEIIEDNVEEDGKEGDIQGNLAEIEALFEDIDTPEIDNEEASINAVSIETITDNHIANDPLINAQFIEIPLDIIRNDSEESVDTEQVSENSSSINSLPPSDIVTNEAEESVDTEQVSENSSSINSLPSSDIITSEVEESVDVQQARESVFTINPQPKSRFSTWSTPKPEFSGFDLIGFNSRGIIDELASKKVKKISTETTIITHNIRKVAEKANKSLEIESDIASETLAKILIIQGHYIKAIAMYKRLSLIFPEKSGLFAAEIKKIENLEDRSA